MTAGMTTTDRAPIVADPGFAVYVHWPFCRSKCPYCDFNSHVRTHPIDEGRFVSAYKTELAHHARSTKGRTVSSIFLGGGTPSLMKPSTVAAILDAIAAGRPDAMAAAHEAMRTFDTVSTGQATAIRSMRPDY